MNLALAVPSALTNDPRKLPALSAMLEEATCTECPLNLMSPLAELASPDAICIFPLVRALPVMKVMLRFACAYILPDLLTTDMPVATLSSPDNDNAPPVNSDTFPGVATAAPELIEAPPEIILLLDASENPPLAPEVPEIREIRPDFNRAPEDDIMS
jgi:hypothetical protein